ncbi:uncharacterized protein LOC100176523 [Ciona intestinalis]
MRLTPALQQRFYGKARGHLTKGKHQIPHLISSSEREKFVKALRQECENEMWLTRSYLSKHHEGSLKTKFRQSSKGAPLVTVNKKADLELENMKYRIHMLPHVHMKDRWDNLKVTERWSKYKHPTDRVYSSFVEAAIPKRYPDFWPRPEEKWADWNKVEGFGLNKSLPKEEKQKLLSIKPFKRPQKLVNEHTPHIQIAG